MRIPTAKLIIFDGIYGNLYTKKPKNGKNNLLSHYF